MKLPYVLLLLSCCASQQTILAHGRRRHLLRNNDEDLHHNNIKDTSSTFRRHLHLPSSHDGGQQHRSLQQQNESLPIISSDMPSDAPSDQPSEDPNPFFTGCDPEWQQKYIELNRTRQEIWTNPICYSYVFVPSCFCPPEYMRPVRINVYNDTIVHMEYVSEPNATVLDTQLFGTMNTLFTGLEQTCFVNCPNVGATFCDIEYDTVNGTIKEVFIDQSEMIMDEEIRYGIFDFDLCQNQTLRK